MVYSLATMVLLSGGVVLYLLAPLTSYVFYSDLRFWKHLQHFHRIFFSLISYLRHALASPLNEYHVSVQLFSPPMNAPSRSVAKVSAGWPYDVNDCGNCYSCCKKFGCSLLDQDKKCLSYGSVYWRYFNCGRFPEDQKQLRFYDCPKWEVVISCIPLFALGLF